VTGAQAEQLAHSSCVLQKELRKPVFISVLLYSPNLKVYWCC